MKNVLKENLKNYIYKNIIQFNEDLNKAYNAFIAIEFTENEISCINTETGEMITYENICNTLATYYEVTIKKIQKQIINKQLEAIWIEYITSEKGDKNDICNS